MIPAIFRIRKDKYGFWKCSKHRFNDGYYAVSGYDHPIDAYIALQNFIRHSKEFKRKREWERRVDDSSNVI